MFLLIKWILVGDELEVAGRPGPTNEDTHVILQAVHDLADKGRMPGDYEHLMLFFRAIGYQQFIYQMPFSFADHTRQFLLFGRLNADHRLSRRFKADIGLEIYEFLQLSILLLVLFVPGGPNRFVDVGWFRHLLIADVEVKAQRFLNTLARTPSAMRDFLLTDKNKGANEYLEQSLFFQMPLINFGGQYTLLHPMMLYRCLEHFVYDRLKKLSPEAFMNSFGDMFEAYVGRVVEYTTIPYFREEQLRELGIEGENVVDYVICDRDANIFVDAKAVSTSHTAMVSHVSRIVRDRTKISALKAIRQALSVNAWLQSGRRHAVLQARQENFLVVVTYRDLYLGNGTRFSQAIAGKDLTDMYNKIPHSHLLPAENIYFVAMDSFERMCHQASIGGVGLIDILQRARNDDRAPTTSKFDFRLHLNAQGVPHEFPIFLRATFDDEWGRVLGLLRR